MGDTCISAAFGELAPGAFGLKRQHRHHELSRFLREVEKALVDAPVDDLPGLLAAHGVEHEVEL